jgi:hypothetical protein
VDAESHTQLDHVGLNVWEAGTTTFALI